MSQSFKRSVLAGIAAGIVAASLGSCAILGPSYSDLNSDTGSDVALPETVEGDAGLNASTARFVGDHVGTQVWLSRGSDDDSVCIILAPLEGTPSVECGTAGNELSATSRPARFYVVPDGGEVPDDGDNTRLSNNVYVISK